MRHRPAITPTAPPAEPLFFEPELEMSNAHPFRALRAKPLWIANGVIMGFVAVLFTVFYVGANLDPAGHLHKLPVALVSADKGASVGRQADQPRSADRPVDREVVRGWRQDRLEVMDEKEMKEELGEGKLFGALVVPRDFTSAVAALPSPKAADNAVRPTLTVLTNQSAGSMGSGMALQATRAAAESASAQVGKELTAQAQAAKAKPSPAALMVLADPAAVHVEDGHPLDSHTGMGLSAFYYSLVLVVCGMLAANVISGQVDHALGYTHSDIGPRRTQNPLLRATRVQTLAISSTLMIGLSLLMGSLVLAGAVGVMGMDAAHLPLLWLFSVSTIAVVGIGGLGLLAAFGTPGMLFITMFYIAMAVPTSGATVPLQALPDFYRVLGEFEPLRQITDAVRSILYYDAQGDAGLTRGWVMLGVGLAVACLFGFGMTWFYDRKGLHRIPADEEPERTLTRV
ncbi:DUF3533 domain-containing protein [Streptomyces sp. NPDC086554]|uniref:DUF3533 domain-containing protein n=1 Tax=Streptomyces sp. NPDC086554 TaxID=3154864 RepID=UPI00342AFFB1